MTKNSSAIDYAVLPKLLYGRQVSMRQCHAHFRYRRADMEFRMGLDLQLRYGDDKAEDHRRDIRAFPQVDRLTYGWGLDL